MLEISEVAVSLCMQNEGNMTTTRYIICYFEEATAAYLKLSANDRINLKAKEVKKTPRFYRNHGAMCLALHVLDMASLN